MKNKTSKKDTKKDNEIELKSSYILSTYTDEVRWKYIKMIILKLGEFVNKYLLLSYMSIILIQIFLRVINVNSIITFILVVAAFFILYNSHKFYINEIIRLKNKKITVSRKKHKKSK